MMAAQKKAKKRKTNIKAFYEIKYEYMYSKMLKHKIKIIIVAFAMGTGHTHTRVWAYRVPMQCDADSGVTVAAQRRNCEINEERKKAKQTQTNK